MRRACDVCGIDYEAQRVSSRYCSGRCRTRATRKGLANAPAAVVPIRQVPASAGAAIPAVSSSGPGPIESATMAELAAVDRTQCAAGQRALMLARLLDTPPPMSLSSVAGWSREHGASLAAATGDADRPRVKSALDLARERRDAQRHA